jgi:hypothetical protein
MKPVSLFIAIEHGSWLSLNRVVGMLKSRSGMHLYARQRDLFYERVLVALSEQNVKLRGCKSAFFEIVYCAPNRKIEKDNLAWVKKWLFDSLVRSGVLVDDRWDNIVGWTEQFVVDTRMPGIRLEMRDEK